MNEKLIICTFQLTENTRISIRQTRLKDARVDKKCLYRLVDKHDGLLDSLSTDPIFLCNVYRQRTVQGMGLRPVACWDCALKVISRLGSVKGL